MVGVPGRSKACNTCRRRKKGCDFGVPACSQCRAAGLECGGYDRDLVWINAGSEPGKTKAAYTKAGRVAAEEMALADRGLPLHTVRGRETVRQHRAKTARSQTHHRTAEGEASSQSQSFQSQLQSHSRVVMHESLVRSSRQEKYLGLFWSAYLPNGRAFSLKASKLSTGGWTGVLGRLFESESTLRLAVLALSASMLGAQNRDLQLRIKGLQTYSEAVQEMAMALRIPSRCSGVGLLAAVRLLEFYEVTFGPEEDGWPGPEDAGKGHKENQSQIAAWRGHNDGLQALLLLRGPKGVQHEPAHQLFVDGRLNAAVAAITDRRRLTLSSYEWKTVPWELRFKSPKDKLMDIMVDTSGLLEDLDTMRAQAASPVAEMLRQELIFKCQDCDRALAIWEDEVGDIINTYDYTVWGKTLHIPKTDQDLALLHLSNLYWAVCMLIYSTMSFALNAMPPRDPVETATDGGTLSQSADTGAHGLPTPSSSGPSPHRERWYSLDPRAYAYKIAWATPLFYEPGLGAFGGSIGLFPLGLSLRILTMMEPPDQPSEERQRLRNLFNKPFMGTFVGRFLINLQRDVPQPSLRQMAGAAGVRERAKMWWYDGIHNNPQDAGGEGSDWQRAT